jgi:hypothetical protein
MYSCETESNTGHKDKEDNVTPDLKTVEGTGAGKHCHVEDNEYVCT